MESQNNQRQIEVIRRGTYKTKISYRQETDRFKEQLDEIKNDEEIIEIKVGNRTFDNFKDAEIYLKHNLTNYQKRLIETIKERYGMLYAVIQESFITNAHANSGIDEAMHYRMDFNDSEMDKQENIEKMADYLIQQIDQQLIETVADLNIEHMSKNSYIYNTE